MACVVGKLFLQLGGDRFTIGNFCLTRERLFASKFMFIVFSRQKIDYFGAFSGPKHTDEIVVLFSRKIDNFFENYM